MSAQRCFAALTLLSGLCLGWCASASAQLIVNEPFTDGNKNGGADNSGAVWWDRSSNTTIDIENDNAGIGTGNALRMDITDTVQVNRAVIGVFSTQTLANVGDQLALSFSFRFTTAPTASSDGFRFGLYNSNGTALVSDNSTATDNDRGYQASIGTGGTASSVLYEETGVGGAGELASGADRTAITGSVFSNVSINDILPHTGQFTIIRTAGGLDFAFSVDSLLRATGSNSSLLVTSFDEIVFSHGIAREYFVDNVTLLYTAATVPEPSSVCLIAGFAGAAAVVYRRKSRAMRAAIT